MSEEFIPPEEADYVTTEMARHDLKVESSRPDKKNLNAATQMGWSGSSVSPYRAAYIKSHSISVSSDASQTSGDLLERHRLELTQLFERNYHGYKQHLVVKNQGNMMALIWRKHLSIGNATLDFEHKKLLGMVNSIEYAINKKDSHALLEVTKLFKDCVDTHFANEARFAQAIKFSFAQHELEHQYLQKALQQMMDKLAVKIGTWSEYVMDYDPQLLRDWLIGHITGEDMKMKPVLQGLPYDFKPV